VNRTYKISDIKKALSTIENKFPDKERIKIQELTDILNKQRTPEIYNVDHLLNNLRAFCEKYPDYNKRVYLESEVSEILKVTKLTLHNWRKYNIITYKTLPSKSIRYRLSELLQKFEALQSKNISDDKEDFLMD